MKKLTTGAAQKRREREKREREGYDRIDWWVQKNAVPVIVALLNRRGLGKAIHGWEKIVENHLGTPPQPSLRDATQQIHLDFATLANAAQEGVTPKANGEGDDVRQFTRVATTGR